MSNPSLDKLPALAAARKAQNIAFFKQLKRKKPRHLDAVASQVHDEVFAQTDCLECANCCKTTGPLFTDQDVNRIAKHLRLKPDTFREQYLRLDEDKDWVLQSVPCTFLDHDNKCFIYEVRPKACREYPHTDRRKLYQIGNLTVRNTAVCPAAYRIVEKLQVALSQR